MIDAVIRTRLLALADALDAMAYDAFEQSRKKPSIFPAYGRLVGRKGGLQDAAEMIRDEVGEEAPATLCDCPIGDCWERTRRCRQAVEDREALERLTVAMRGP